MVTRQFIEECIIVDAQTVDPDGYFVRATAAGQSDELVADNVLYEMLVSSTGTLEATSDGLRVAAGAAGAGLGGGGANALELDFRGLTKTSPISTDLVVFQLPAGGLRQCTVADLPIAVELTFGMAAPTSTTNTVLLNGETAVLTPATPTEAGLLSAADKVILNSLSAQSSDLSLVNPNATNIQIANDAGTGVTLQPATNLLAGILSAADKAALDDLVSNPTDLGIGTSSATTVTITNTSGSNAVLPGATGSAAGVMTASDKTALDALVASSVDLSLANPTSSSITIANTGGLDVVLVAATGAVAGLMSATDKTALDSLVANPTNLAVNPGTGTTVEITNSSGTNAVLTSATISAAGLMSAADKVILDGLAGFSVDLSLINPNATTVQVGNTGGADLTLTGATPSVAGIMTAADKTALNSLVANPTNLAVNPGTATSVEITNSSGTNAVLTSATITAAGLLSAADKAKLDAAVGGAIDLGVTAAATTLTVTNTGGDNAVLPAATGSTAGVMSAADKTTLDSLSASSTNLGIGSPASATTVTITNSVGTDAVIPAATGSAAGVMTAADRTSLTALAAQSHDIALANRTTTAWTITNAAGADATLTSATTSLAGLMSSADKTALDGLVANPTNLSVTPAPTTVEIVNSSGTNATLEAATVTNAGLLSAADKSELDQVTSFLITTPTANSLIVSYDPADAQWAAVDDIPLDTTDTGSTVVGFKANGSLVKFDTDILLSGITVDNVLTDLGTNPVEGGVIKAYVDALPGQNVDDAVSDVSTNPVENGVITSFAKSIGLVRDGDQLVVGTNTAAVDTTAMQTAATALNSQGYGTLWIAGTVALNNLVRFSAPISVRGVDQSAEVVATAAEAAIQWWPLAGGAGTYWDVFSSGAVTGSPVASVLDANMNAGKSRFVCSGQSFAVGDFVTLWSDDVIPDVPPHHGGSGQQHPMEIHRIGEVSGNTYVIDGVIVDNLTTANGAKVRRVPMLMKPGANRSDVLISDLRFRQTFETADEVMLSLGGLHGVRIERLSWSSGTIGGPGAIFLDHCTDVRIDNIAIDERERFIDAGTGYGVIVTVTNDVRVRNSRFLKCRHCITTGSSKSDDNTLERWGTPRNLVFENNYVLSRPSANAAHFAIDSHAEGYEFLIQNNLIELQGDASAGETYECGGINVRARKTLIRGNTFTGHGYGKAIHNQTSQTVVDGNYFSGGWIALLHDNNADYPNGWNDVKFVNNHYDGGRLTADVPVYIENGKGHIIAGNTFSNLNGTAIRFRNQSAVAVDGIREVEISNNVFKGGDGLPTSGIGVIYCDDDVYGMTIANNTFSRLPVCAVQQAASGTNWHIIGNTFHDVGTNLDGVHRYLLRIRKGSQHRIVNNELSRHVGHNNNTVFVGTNGANPAIVDDLTDNDVQVAGHTLQVGSAVIFGGTALPGGVNAGQIYFVIAVNGDFFTVSEEPGGAELDFTSPGTSVTVEEVPDITFVGNAMLGYGASSLGLGGSGAVSVLNSKYSGYNWTD